MAKIIEEDAISDAIIETEREIAGEAWGQEETERDGSGRSLEGMGDGLEGQNEPEEDEETEVEETEETEEPTGEDPALAAAKTEPVVGEQPKVVAEKPLPAQVPSGMLREANEKARTAIAERDALKAELAKAGETQTLAARLDQAMREIAELRRGPPPAPKVETEAKKRPDLFEDPDGAIAFVEQGLQSQLAPLSEQMTALRIQSSMQIAEAVHGEAFTTAFQSLMQLDKSDPNNRALAQRIAQAPNPGRAVMQWHKDQVIRSRVGDDPDAYEQRLRDETRNALMKDPEFRKQILAEQRAEALQGNDGTPRTITRLPKSLNGATGSNLGVNRGDPNDFDDSDSAVAESAWR
jgi:hypothetical protein